MSKEAIEFLCKISPSFKNMDINSMNTFGGKFLLYCIDKALKQGQSLPIDSVSCFTAEKVEEAYRDGWNDRDIGTDTFHISNYC